jgi:hypothetical protein
MDYDCGKTGCTGGGTFVLLVFAVWLLFSFAVLFMEAESVKGYIKELPFRIIGFVIITAVFLGIAWVLARLGL